MNSDSSIGYWLQDIPYEFHGDSFETGSRKYFVHENTVVYNRSGNKIEVYLGGEMELFLFDPRKASECARFFQVMNPYQIDVKSLHMNGESIDLGNQTPYLELWKIAVRKRSFCGSLRIGGAPSELKGLTIPLETMCVHRLGSIARYKIPPKKLRATMAYDWKKIAEENIKNRFPSRKYGHLIDTVPSNFPRKPWKSREKPHPQNIHWGQLKLLIAEINFLNFLPYNQPRIVVYAGAAAGYHIPLLSRMYHDILFILYDPADFGIKPSPNIVIRKEFFTDEVAKMYHGMHVVFISDIRLSADDPKDFEKMVHNNNLAVARWVEYIQPDRSSLKFRFPFDWKGPYEYLAGRIHVQQFAPELSAETRLWLVDAKGKRKSYDIIAHEETMFYFNTEYRNRSFLDKDGVFGVNYDTIALFEIIREYLILVGEMQESESIEVARVKVAAFILDGIIEFRRSSILQTLLPWLK